MKVQVLVTVSNPNTITLPCFGIVVTLGEPDPDHSGHFLGGRITSDLHEDADNPTDSKDYKTAIDALESLILAHACAGIDITAPAYIEGIETAVQACANQLS